MSEQKRRLVDRITEPIYLEGLAERSVDELRSMREECSEGENELSFERRLCQARIDILEAELERRAGGEDADLVSQLPRILAGEMGRAEGPLPQRAPDLTVPRSADVPRRRVEEIVGEQTMSRLPQLSKGEITKIAETLGELERAISTKRKRAQEVLDAIQAELVRRYRSGEADPSAILR